MPIEVLQKFIKQTEALSPDEQLHEQCMGPEMLNRVNQEGLRLLWYGS
jgi:hypothetical protein